MQKDKPIRILHIFGRMNRGGAETFIMNIYRNINREKIQFDFAVETNEVSHYDDEIRNLGGRIIPHPSPSVHGFRAYGKALSETLMKYGPYAGVHSHVHFFSGYVLFVAKKMGVPLLLAHSHSTQDGKHDSLKRKTYRLFMQKLILINATHLLGCSRIASESLFGVKCWKDPRVKFIPNAIDPTPFEVLEFSHDKTSLRMKNNLPINVPIIGHVGRFNEPKNHKFLIGIFAELLKSLPSAHLLLVGDGPLRSEIENMVLSKGISNNVHFLGIREDIPSILKTMDLLLFPSLYEGLPVSLVEAQIAGLRCVVSDTITSEADLGGVKYVSLQANSNLWIEQILNSLTLKSIEWTLRKSALQERGFDVKDLAIKLEDLYA